MKKFNSLYHGIKNDNNSLPIELPEIINPFLSFREIDNIYVCGGYIRDFFIYGKPGKDIDIFVNCSKDELNDLTEYLSAFGRIEYGQYGSPRYYPLTPLTKNFNDYVDIVPFYNFIVSDKRVTTIEELLHNFDFSANALAYNIKTRQLYNPENGLLDIKNKTLRAIRIDFPEKKVSASINLSTNTVFWFRLLHFQNRLCFSFESSTEKWVTDNSWRFRYIGEFSRHFFRPLISQEMIMKMRLSMA